MATTHVQKGTPGPAAHAAYLWERLRNLRFAALWQGAKRVAAKTGSPAALVALDMVRCGLLHGAGYRDYEVFEIHSLTHAQRKTYITRGRNNFIVRQHNPREHWHILEQKPEFLARFSAYIGRGWLNLATAGKADFNSFCAQYPHIVAKPPNGTCGTGLRFIATAGANTAALYAQLVQNGLTLVEQTITQHPALARLYAGSVNTLRLVTLRGQAGPALVFCAIRIGNGKQVDNLNSGGMAAIINAESGAIATPAADKTGNQYTHHPHTGAQVCNVPIPHFSAAKRMVLQAAQELTELGYVAWDVAVTSTGPLLIEANHFPGHDIYQFQCHLPPNKTGLLPRFMAASHT